MRVIAAALLAFPMLFPVCAAKAQMSMSGVQKEVWAQEEAYCQYRMENDLDGFMSLWDEQSVGWPSFAPKPLDKSGTRESVAKVMKIVTEGTRYECSVIPFAVNMFGDIANTHYLFHYKMTNKEGASEEHTSRIFHTWRRTDGHWKIIGGMSAPEGATQN